MENNSQVFFAKLVTKPTKQIKPNGYSCLNCKNL